MRREAGRVALRRPCAAVARPSTEQGGRRGQDGARSEGCGRPPSRGACGTGSSVAEACARSQGQALWSLGAARGGARPRAHTQAVVSRRRSPLRSAAEWTGREPTRSRPTAWCRAALEPRRSARTPSGRRPSQPPARRLNRTASGPLARLRTAGAAGSGGGRSAGMASQPRHAECGALQTLDTVAGRRSGVPYLFILMGGRLPKRVMLKRVACTRTRSHSRRRQYAAYLSPGTRRC